MPIYYHSAMGIDIDKIQVDWELAANPTGRMDEDYTGWNRWFYEDSVFHLSVDCSATKNALLQPLYAGLTVEEITAWHPGHVCQLCTI